MPVSVFNDGNERRNERRSSNNSNSTSISTSSTSTSEIPARDNRSRLSSNLSNVLQHVLRTQSARAFGEPSSTTTSPPPHSAISSLVRAGNVFRRPALIVDNSNQLESQTDEYDTQNTLSTLRPVPSLSTSEYTSPPPIRSGSIYRSLDYYCPIPRQTADEVYANLRSLRLRRSEVLDQYRRSPSNDSSRNHDCVDKLSVIDSVLDFLKIEKGLESESISNLKCSWLRPGSKFTGTIQPPIIVSNPEGRRSFSSNQLIQDNLSIQVTIGSIDYNRQTVSGSIITSEPSIYFSLQQPIEEYWNGEIIDPLDFCRDVVRMRQKERKEIVSWTSTTGNYGRAGITFHMNNESTNFDKLYLNFSRLQGLSLFSIFSADELIHHLEDPLFARKLRHRFVIMKWKTTSPEKHYFIMVWRGSGYIEGFVYEHSKDYQNRKLNLSPERRGSMGFPSYSFA